MKINSSKLKNDVSSLYAVFRTQQLAINKELLLQMEEVEFMEKVLDSLSGVKEILRGLRVGKIKSYIGSICSKSKAYSKNEIKIMGEYSNDLGSYKRPRNLAALKNRRKFKSDQRLFCSKTNTGKDSGIRSKGSLNTQQPVVKHNEGETHLQKMKKKLDDYFDSQKKKKLPRSTDYFSINKKLADRRKARFSYEKDFSKNYTILEPGEQRISEGNYEMQSIGFYNAGNLKLRSTDSISISPIQTHKTPVAAALRRKLRSNKRLFNRRNVEQNNKSIKKSLDLDMLSQHKPLRSLKIEPETSRSKIEIESPIMQNSKGFVTSRAGDNRHELVQDSISQSFYMAREAFKPSSSTRLQYRPNMEDISLDDLEVVFEEKNKNNDHILTLKSNKMGRSVRNLDRFLKIGKISTPDFVCNGKEGDGFLSMTATDLEKNKKNFSGFGFRIDKSKMMGKGRVSNNQEFRENVESDFFKKLKKFNPLDKKTKKKKARTMKKMRGRKRGY